LVPLQGIASTPLAPNPVFLFFVITSSWLAHVLHVFLFAWTWWLTKRRLEVPSFRLVEYFSCTFHLRGQGEGGNEKRGSSAPRGDLVATYGGLHQRRRIGAAVLCMVIKGSPCCGVPSVATYSTSRSVCQGGPRATSQRCSSSSCLVPGDGM
jgi:hypothetical protein